ncbi:hypothetical protein FRC02_001247 [Tulasnella sp. 418]|nr:hypothetical protein FRC02_001247 [Tulasnella sp. 418]
MTSPTAAKRVLTETNHLLSQARQASSSIISAEVNLQLQNVGRRIRQSVTEGYKLALLEPSNPPPTVTQDDIAIFKSNSDTLREVYGRPRELGRYCDSGEPPVYGRVDGAEGNARKRRTKDNDESEENTPEDGEDGTAMVAAPPPLESRAIRAPPRRRSGLQKTQSLPVGALTFGKGSSSVSVAPTLQPIPSPTLTPVEPWNPDEFKDLFTRPEEF